MCRPPVEERIHTVVPLKTRAAAHRRPRFLPHRRRSEAARGRRSAARRGLGNLRVVAVVVGSARSLYPAAAPAAASRSRRSAGPASVTQPWTQPQSRRPRPSPDSLCPVSTPAASAIASSAFLSPSTAAQHREHAPRDEPVDHPRNRRRRRGPSSARTRSTSSASRTSASETARSSGRPAGCRGDGRGRLGRSVSRVPWLSSRACVAECRPVPVRAAEDVRGPNGRRPASGAPMSP
jgi:hypothetical protein